MKAKDLRIGNYVTEEGRLIHLHDGFGIDHAHNFKPIPLTEDWLVKFGFEKDEIEERFKNIGESLYLWWDDLYKELHLLNSNDDVSILLIKHVHQLQNLYHALTGEELTIKQ